MKNPVKLLVLGFALLGFVFTISAQDDEARQTMGLPMEAGKNSGNQNKTTLSGRITIQGLEPSQPKPTLFVAVYLSGALVDKRQVNDSGNYLVPGVPREGATLAIEGADGMEITRYPLPSSTMGYLRQDISISWAQIQSTKSKTGVISVKSFYQRSDENEKLLEKAVTASKEKKSDGAVTLFKQLLKNDPKDFVAWTELGTLFFKNEKYSDAEEAYNKALELKPDFIVALVNAGKLYLQQNQPDKAIPFLTKAVETEPNSADANHYLGEAYLLTKKGSKAVAYLNEAIRLAPVEKAEIHLRLAALYNGAGMKDRAVTEYKMFLEKVPDFKEKEKIEKYIKENSPK